MVTKELIAPKSIVVVGASDDVYKPGGRVLENLIQYKYSGQLYAVNPRPPRRRVCDHRRCCQVLPTYR